VPAPRHMPLLTELDGIAVRGVAIDMSLLTELENNLVEPPCYKHGAASGACPSGPMGEMPGWARYVPYLDIYGRPPLHRMEGASPDTRRSLAVVPPLANGGTTARLRRVSGEAPARPAGGTGGGLKEYGDQWLGGSDGQTGFAPTRPRHTSQAHGRWTEHDFLVLGL
jgi:hypothetical protein